MCGIAGIITGMENGFNVEELGLHYQNMIVNQVRGVDSTGMFSAHKGDPIPHVRKIVGPATNFFAHEGWQEYKSSLLKDGEVLIGHGRAATRGTVSLENAHPFQVAYEDDPNHCITLVHNGTLLGMQQLPDFHKYPVDSLWIAHCLQAHGVEETLAKADGAMALVWIDTKTGTLNFFRNDERPLHYAEIAHKNSTVTLINSEAHALRWLMNRNAVKSIHKDDVFYFQPMHVYTLKLDDLGADFVVSKKIKKIVRPVPISMLPAKHRTQAATETNKLVDRENDPIWAEIMDNAWAAWLAKRLGMDADVPEAEDSEPRPTLLLPSGRRTEAMGKAPWLRGRSYCRDVQMVMLEKFAYVEWEGSLRRTMLRSGAILLEKGKPPYENYLARIEKHPSKDNILLRTYTANGNDWTIEIPVTPSMLKHFDVPGKQDDERQQKVKEKLADPKPGGLTDTGMPLTRVGGVDYINPAKLNRHKPGRHVRWHTRDEKNQSIPHNAVLKQGVTLERYTNIEDGVIVLGDFFQMEVTDLVEIKPKNGIGMPFWQVIAQRLSPGGKKDQYVQFHWFVLKEEDADAALNVAFWEGKVAQIAFASHEEYEKSGAHIEVLLNEVVAAGGMRDVDAEKDANEAA